MATLTGKHRRTRTYCWIYWLVAVLPAFSATAQAPQSEQVSPAVIEPLFTADSVATGVSWQFDEYRKYPLGISSYKLNSNSSLTGWKLNQRWYLGRNRGDRQPHRQNFNQLNRAPSAGQKGLVLIRDGATTRLAVGVDGLELKLRF